MGQCAHKIIKDGSCANQNIVKQNMETRSNYLLKKKGTEKEKKRSKDRGRPSTTDSFGTKR